MSTLQPGDQMPDFKGVDQDQHVISSRDFRGKKLIIYFYPKDNTPGCTAQACNLRDNYEILMEEGFAVLGISADSVKSHKKFEEKFDLPFPLIADEDKVILNAFGVWGPKKFMGKNFDGIRRTTFLVDEQGIIRHIIQKPDTKHHTEEILELWEQGSK